MAVSANPGAAPDPARAARIDLAAALRLAARFGFNEGICNHFSLALPGAHERFLLNPYGRHWSEIRASDLLEVDTGGRVMAGAGATEATAFFIHSRIHRGNARAACVLHTHMPHATALTTLAHGRLEWISQTSAKFYGRVAYYDGYGGLALDEAEGDRICDALGGKQVLFLANHGVIVAGDSVAQAFDDLYYLERAAELQLLAYQSGRPLRRLSEDMLRQTAEQMAADRQNAFAHFAALKRLLDRDAPDYAE
jgi:ribulose-5-phosphate 4-epimerase/fuculose-1-phosphate aldolase